MSAEKKFLASDPDQAFDRIARYNPRINKAFYDSMAHIFGAYVHLQLDDFIVRGGHNIPETGSFIAAPNHRSHLDHAFVGKPIHDQTGRHMQFMAKDGFWKDKYGAIAGRFVERGGGFPIARDTGLGIDGQPLVRAMLDTIFANGHGLVMYPQGKRVNEPTEGQLIGDLKTGVAQTAIRYQSPILPVGIAGARERDVVVVNFGSLIPPLQIEDPTDQTLLRGAARLQTALLHDSLTKLCLESNQLRADYLQYETIDHRG